MNGEILSNTISLEFLTKFCIWSFISLTLFNFLFYFWACQICCLSQWSWHHSLYLYLTDPKILCFTWVLSMQEMTFSICARFLHKIPVNLKHVQAAFTSIISAANWKSFIFGKSVFFHDQAYAVGSFCMFRERLERASSHNHGTRLCHGLSNSHSWQWELDKHNIYLCKKKKNIWPFPTEQEKETYMSS